MTRGDESTVRFACIELAFIVAVKQRDIYERQARAAWDRGLAWGKGAAADIAAGKGK
jgi:hypothetical protein